MDDNKAKALAAALSQIEKQFGKGSIMRMGDGSIERDIQTVSTGSLGLDIALGLGGLPRGRVVEIYGPESSGKTTLTLQVIAEMQKLGGTAAFIDAEHALDVGYAEKLGVNLDDLGDHRPGQQAAAERGAAFPLVDAGFTKADVREHSRRLGLSTWDKPAAACLASRVPYGTPVTLGRLSAVERAEAALRRLGFRELRVRHHGEVARIEVPEHQLDAVVAQRADGVAAGTAAGYRWATLDLAGLRSGGFNSLLSLADGAP